MTSKDDHKDSECSPEDAKQSRPGLGRREFVKLVGGTGVAVTAELFGGQKLASGATPLRQALSAGTVVGPGGVPMTLHVNGEVKKLTIEPRVTLLDALRNHLDLTGAKKVCDRGTCGSCTVIINGKAVYSCNVLAIEVAEYDGHPGADIHTIEGLTSQGKLHPISASFVNNDAQQCGFCTPGFVMACKAFLDEHHDPTVEQVKEALGGNLCRCGTYMGVRKAVVEAAMKMKGGHG
jgi:xanthine dehydrogenase YagT iron-sulfur-binding subunit